MEFNEKLQQLRTGKNLTQEQLAEQLYVSRTAISKWERVFQNHTQPIPCEQYDEVCGQSQLFRKFASLSYQWDVDKIDQTRYGWLASVENEQLLLRLKKLSKKDLELLTLLFVDGYRQIDVARLWHCSRSAVAQRFKKIKKFLNNT